MPDPQTGQGAPRKVSLALLTLIAFSGTLAMHIFVPALPSAAKSLATDEQTIQLSITVYILGLAIGQLAYGPIADALGRRPAVLGGLAIYVVGSIGCFLAPNVPLLLTARLVQALGGAGGLALTRVIVADNNKGVAATRGLAVLNLVMLIGPGLAPIVGAEIAELFGWRANLLFLSVMGVGAMVLAAWLLPETGTPTGSFRIGQIASNIAALARVRDFRRSVIGGATGSTACYAYFVSAPFILHSSMGLSIQAVGYAVGATLGAAALGNLATRSIVGRVSDRAIQLSFAALGAAAGGLFLILAIGDWLTPVSTIGLSCVILFAAGALNPVTVGAALSDAGTRVGAASGIFGSFQMVTGVVCTFIAGLFSDHALGTGIILLVAYLVCWSQFYLRGRTG